MLKDADAGVRRGAAHALSDIIERLWGEPPSEVVGVVPVLAAAFAQDADGAVREHAFRALCKIGPSTEAALPEVVTLLKAPSPDARVKAAQVLGHMGQRARTAVPALIESLGDPSPRVREEAASTLGSVGVTAGEAIPRCESSPPIASSLPHSPSPSGPRSRTP